MGKKIAYWFVVQHDLDSYLTLITMPTLSTMQRSLIAIVLLIIALVFSIPWGLYYLGLKDVGGRPDLPARMISSDMQQKIWAESGYEGQPESVALNPVSYILSASGQDAPPPVTLFAWRVASSYQRQHHAHDGVMWQQLSGGALTIWLSRHWTIEQLLSKVAELEEKKRQTSKAD